ncbi:MAG: hypothetical protein CML50_14165 [Rhodobacteraceae bacterium]|jgi:hypothetical protein|uniref:Uncharacterized protein n=1 Tax=Salipiger profundus TaxID=1229727 RepID=A0A1U7D6F2_9RHOB|nr:MULTISPECIES: hypothetical protein [Salipiger]APX23703.1 hypothetical protein Ga0080559_TMP2907 [Salipiger profundus]MAB07139.1 hypothetical protein [Paracoccaceae bacterium]GGA17334.1 hypothetical protein GCM10011326_32350 [Salipiger profundus]SFD31352.1 hypothetical protein SAMN05444415_109167 [Salipiger profundus]
MTSRIEQILARIDALHDELEAAIAERRAQFRYRLERNSVRFEAEAKRRHRALRVRLGTFLARANPWHVATAPLIYSLIFPFALLDLFVSVYQAVCFRAYGIPRVKRRDHIRIDRQHLAYLNALQKLNCVYCGYCNGLLSYVTEIASRTEAFWCPIKHAARVAQPHRRYPEFMDYGDAEGFDSGLARSREAVTRDDA